jgi:hypothetical protein
VYKLLISSHDKAYDIWHITDFFIKKSKLKADIYLGANGEDKREFLPKEWSYINTGEDISFSKSLISYLKNIDSEYFILMLDDFMILEEVDMEKIALAFDFIKKNSGVYLRLKPNPSGDTKIDRDFSKIDVKGKVPYITSLQMAIWKKDFLIQLLKYDFSPWEFETKAGKTQEALSHYRDFYVTNYPFIHYTHFVEKGKYYPNLKDRLKQNGISLISDRKFLSDSELKTTQDSKIKIFIRNLLPKSLYIFLRKLLMKKEL